MLKWAGIIVLISMAYYIYVQFQITNSIKNLSNKHILITGASLGIGKELVKAYATSNVSKIVIVSRTFDKLNNLRDEIMNNFHVHSQKSNIEMNIPEIFIIPADLSNESTCHDVIDKAIELMGSIDYLVLNHITNSNYGLWQKQKNHNYVSQMFNVNTLSYIWMSDRALETLQENNGQIVVISSFAGFVGTPNTAIYSATKHALRGYFSALRVELEYFNKENKIGITIANIGPVDTEGSKPIQNIINVNWIQPDSVAQVIVRGSGSRLREIYFPSEIFASIILHFIYPPFIEYILYLTMA